MTSDLEIRLACRALLDDYAVAVDTGDAAAMIALFAPDGALVRGELELKGADEIPRILEGRPGDLKMRHLLTTVSVTPSGDGRSASGHSYYLLFNGRGDAFPLPLATPFSLGDWLSRFVLTDAGWRLQRHEVRRVFARNAA